MSDLERMLTELGPRIEFPETPALAPRVRARVSAAPARRVRRFRPALVVAFVLLLCGGALAASPLRDDILDFLGIGGVEVKQVPKLPPAPSKDLALGERVSSAEAARRTEFDWLVPAGLGHPQAFWFRPDPPGGQVSVTFPRPRGVFSAFDGSIDENFIQKSIGPGTTVRTFTRPGVRGFFLSGKPHAFVYVDRDGQVRDEDTRLATNTLIWQRRGVV
jgi:hypothetical protein